MSTAQSPETLTPKAVKNQFLLARKQTESHPCAVYMEESVNINSLFILSTTEIGTYDCSLMTLVIAFLKCSAVMVFRSRVVPAPRATMCTMLSACSPNKGMPTTGTP